MNFQGYLVPHILAAKLCGTRVNEQTLLALKAKSGLIEGRFRKVLAEGTEEEGS